ncbi:MAG: 4Fe-4S binding protein [Desulfobacteraceae bacterium]|nr:4Fe-4S binding protein [Desulfobacteraceae bacterium]
MDNLPYKNAVLYVMSGTGNTYRAARWVLEFAGPYIENTRIVMIDGSDTEDETIHSRDTLVGVLFPAHGFMPPWSMIKFLLGMRRQKRVPALCAATRGGIKVGPLRIPGAAGLGTFLAAFLMMIKGYRPRALFSLDMPSNLINFHWGLYSKNVAAITGKAEQKLAMLVPRIMEGRSVYFTRNNLWEAMWSIGIFWLIPVFPLLYLLIGKLFMAKLMFSSDRCVGCGRCARFCPNQAIEMRSAGKKKRPYWTYHCEVCLRCMGYCSKRAVEAGHLWAILLYFIISIPVFTALLLWLHELSDLVPAIRGYWPTEILNLIYVLPALFFSYWLFWHLIRIPMMNTFFTITTLTHYYRRYHEPETRLKHMAQRHKTGSDSLPHNYGSPI